MRNLMFAALAGLLLTTAAAMAATVETSPLTNLFKSGVDLAVYAAATAIVGLIGAAANRLFGLTLEQRHREALHSALTTGASLAISLVAELIGQGFSPSDARQIAFQEGLNHVKEGVPDAVRALKLGDADERLLGMLKAKEIQLKLGAVAGIAPSPSPAA